MAGRGVINPGAFAASLCAALAAGIITWVSVRDYIGYYDLIYRPLWSPGCAGFVFLWILAWASLFCAGYLLCAARTHPAVKTRAGKLFALQLGAVFCWAAMFFRFQAYTLSFALSVLLWSVTLAALPAFSGAGRAAGMMQLPCLAWFFYVACLNLGICLLN